MTVDVEALVRQAIRWKAATHATSSRETAHSLLEKLPPDQRVHLQWSCDGEWQFVFDRKIVTSGSFEDCVTAFARMFYPTSAGRDLTTCA